MMKLASNSLRLWVHLAISHFTSRSNSIHKTGVKRIGTVPISAEENFLPFSRFWLSLSFAMVWVKPENLDGFLPSWIRFNGS